MHSPADTTAALLSAGDLCWSPPAHARLTTRGAPLPPGHQALAEFLLIPSAQRPRLLVPAGAPAAAAESVRRFSQALNWPERAVRTVLTGTLRAGLLDRVLPDRMCIYAPEAASAQVASLAGHVGDLLGEPVVLSLGVGTARANRKPVLEAITSSGKPLAFIKLGDSDVTRSLLAAEAGALQRLAENRPASLLCPRLLHLGEWNGIGVLAQTALRTPPWRTHRRHAIPFGPLRSLVQAFDSGRLPVAESPAWQRIAADTDAIAEDTRARSFAQTAKAINAALGDHALRHSAWHGDWTPWNMAWVGSQARVWDWERFAEGVPVGFDALHYVLAQHMVTMPWGRALDTMRSQAPEVLRQAGVAPSENELTVLWYLLELCRRYLLAAAPSSGSPLRPRADGLLSYLYTAAHAGEPAPILPDWSAE